VAWRVGGEVRRVGTHPKVFVARVTHNNYPVPRVHEPLAIPISDELCGVTEDVDEEVRERLDDLEESVDTVKSVVVTVAKVAAGLCVGAIFGPLGCTIGAAVGGIAAAIEAAAASSDDESDPVDDAVAEEMEQDHPPDEGAYGLVLTPSFLETTLPDAGDAVAERAFAETPEAHIVDGEIGVWWPGGGRDPGYDGRWGVMYQHVVDEKPPHSA
jgi:tetrahydromethanopterin S-methyltransferase subunit G